jgi:hypothetical protein
MSTCRQTGPSAGLRGCVCIGMGRLSVGRWRRCWDGGRKTEGKSSWSCFGRIGTIHGIRIMRGRRRRLRSKKSSREVTAVRTATSAAQAFGKRNKFPAFIRSHLLLYTPPPLPPSLAIKINHPLHLQPPPPSPFPPLNLSRAKLGIALLALATLLSFHFALRQIV